MPFQFIKIFRIATWGDCFQDFNKNHFLPHFIRIVKLLWNFGTVILLLWAFHEKPKHIIAFFFFFNAKGHRREGERRERVC